MVIRKRFELRVRRRRRDEPVEAGLAAAVCFRRRDRHLQLRLVRRGDDERWGLPEGRPRARESLAEAAARRASEEAGVTGVVNETPLLEGVAAQSSDGDSATVFLLAVQSVAPPGEHAGDGAWFDLASARRKLAEGRDEAAAGELRRVLDAAELELRDAREEVKDAADAVDEVDDLAALRRDRARAPRGTD